MAGCYVHPPAVAFECRSTQSRDKAESLVLPLAPSLSDLQALHWWVFYLADIEKFRLTTDNDPARITGALDRHEGNETFVWHSQDTEIKFVTAVFWRNISSFYGCFFFFSLQSFDIRDLWWFFHAHQKHQSFFMERRPKFVHLIFLIQVKKIRSLATLLRDPLVLHCSRSENSEVWVETLTPINLSLGVQVCWPPPPPISPPPTFIWNRQPVSAHKWQRARVCDGCGFLPARRRHTHSFHSDLRLSFSFLPNRDQLTFSFFSLPFLNCRWQCLTFDLLQPLATK